MYLKFLTTLLRELERLAQGASDVASLVPNFKIAKRRRVRYTQRRLL